MPKGVPLTLRVATLSSGKQTLIKMKLEQVNLFVLGKESTPSIPRKRIF